MAMPDVYDQIYKYAKQYIKEQSKYSPSILKDTPPDKKFPLIIIRELDDTLWNENLDKTDQRFNIEYEIEMYTINKGKIAKQEIMTELVNLVNDVFDVHYGLRRAFNQQIPNVDTEVCRWEMRYEGKTDENKIIYRR